MANNDFYHCNNDNDSNDDHSTMITANNDLSENRDDQRNQSHNYSSNNTAINKRLPTVTLDIHKGEPIRLQVKVMVPSDDHPNYNFVGKLLGPKGKSLKWLQERTKTKMAILGRGSMRNKQKEKELRESNDTKYSHLNENLHVEITAIATAAEAYHRIGEALFELKRFLVPDYFDEIRQQQLKELGVISDRHFASSPMTPMPTSIPTTTATAMTTTGTLAPLTTIGSPLNHSHMHQQSMNHNTTNSDSCQNCPKCSHNNDTIDYYQYGHLPQPQLPSLINPSLIDNSTSHRCCNDNNNCKNRNLTFNSNHHYIDNNNNHNNKRLTMKPYYRPSPSISSASLPSSSLSVPSALINNCNNHQQQPQPQQQYR